LLGELKAAGFMAFDENIRVGNVNEYVWETHRRRRALIGGLDLTSVLENLGL
jgi:hypothetical protein